MSTFNSRAIVQRGNSLVVEETTLPQLEKHQVLVRVESAAFNPTDRLAFDLQAFGDGAVLGCDFAGIVTQTHSSVTKLKVGDRIGALVWGGENKGVGAYSTHCIADERLSFKIPNSIDNLESCSLSLAVNTAWLALFSTDCLAYNRSASGEQPPLLVWGGSTAVGYYTIQLATMHGIKVATTCSERNFDLVKEAGATHVFDYRDKDVIDKLQSAFPTLHRLLDTIGSIDSSSTASKAFNNRDGLLCTVRPGKANTSDVPFNIKVTDVFVFTALPYPHTYRGSFHWPVHEENHQLSVDLYDKLPTLLEEGTLKPLQTTNMGILSPENVQQAFNLNRSGKISAQKLCFTALEG